MSLARTYRAFAWRVLARRVWQGMQIAVGLGSILFLATVAAYCAGVRW